MYWQTPAVESTTIQKSKFEILRAKRAGPGVKVKERQTTVSNWKWEKAKTQNVHTVRPAYENKLRRKIANEEEEAKAKQKKTHYP